MFTDTYTRVRSCRQASVFLLVVALVTVGACQSRTELHIAYHPWIGYETLPLAEQFGWLPGNVVLRRLDSASASVRALIDGEVQAAAITLDEALRLRATLPDLQVVLVMNESAGADVLLARPELADLRALTGVRVAYEKSAVSELLLRSALESGGLEPEDVELVDLPHAQHEAAYRAGEVDAVVTYPPGSARIQALGASTLFDSSQIPGTILDVLVIDPGRLGYRGDLLGKTIAAHFRVLEHLRSSRDDVVYRIAALQGTTAKEVSAALAGVRLPAEASVASYLRPGGAVITTAEALLEQGLLGDAAAGVALDQLVDTRYLPRDAAQ